MLKKKKKSVLMAKKKKNPTKNECVFLCVLGCSFLHKVLGKRGERDGSLMNTSGSSRGHRLIPKIHVTAHNCL